MATKRERDIVAKLMVVIANALDPNRKEPPIEAPHYAEGEMRPEFTLEQLRPLAKEAMDDAQKMFASWGGGEQFR